MGFVPISLPPPHARAPFLLSFCTVLYRLDNGEQQQQQQRRSAGLAVHLQAAEGAWLGKRLEEDRNRNANPPKTRLGLRFMNSVAREESQQLSLEKSAKPQKKRKKERKIPAL